MNLKAENLKDEGNTCFRKNDYRAALELYKEACKCDPGNPVYYSNMAMTLIKLEIWPEAINACNEGLSKINEADSQADKIKQKLLWRRETALDKLQLNKNKNLKLINIKIKELYTLPDSFEKL
ncbi:HHL070Cp [Eremothecium sinecaudum]|uniref:HHL070Cp n=1 Tax=Eremothecium sinecaudum TaxID=45286 RepID=A0A0X8HWH4_9SACH|nr:HHL070Cp [Eremothecium sinecaudum]AMD22700.1 HHL070Cp [Eremothecium sinecaudum]